MADWPSVPLERNLASWLHRHIRAVALALLVAYDIHGTESVRSDESVVEVVRLPSYSRGDGSLVLERSVPTLVCHAIGDDFVDVTVGCHEGRKEENEGKHYSEVDEK
jgi:hypothetical protein